MGVENLTWLVVSLVIGIAVFVFISSWAFKIPGFAGQILGFISQRFSLAVMSILDWLGQIFSPIINTVHNAVQASILSGVTVAGAMILGSFLAGGVARTVIGMVSHAAATGGWRLALGDLANFAKVGWRSLAGGLTNALTCAGIAFVSYLAADFAVVPWVSQNIHPVMGSAVGGVMKGGLSSAFIFGGVSIAGHTLGAGLLSSIAPSLGITAGTGPLALAAFPSAIVGSIVKHHSGLEGWQGGLATIGSSALTGAATGALIGSVVPGLGTAIGAGVGAIVGAVAGAFTWFF